MSHIIIAGGGASGLELLTNLRKKLSKKHKITLIEPESHHYWKPKLHEVATGTFDERIDGISYFSHSYRYGYSYIEAFLRKINIKNKTIYIEGKNKKQTLNYDYLIIATGAISNDFGTPDAKGNCLFLDSTYQAVIAWKKLELIFKYSKGDTYINIIGGGATGVELSSEIMSASKKFKKFNPELNININLIESNKRLLAHLTEKLSQQAELKLKEIGVNLYLGTRVSKVDKDGSITINGEKLLANLQYWTAGIKAPDWITSLGDFKFNKLNQIEVNQDLTTTVSNFIFSLGDCASIPQENNTFVPPKAQAANRAAIHLANSLSEHLEKEKTLTPFIYNDSGMIISIGHKYAIGEMKNGKVIIKGRAVRSLYDTLFCLHQKNVIGMYRVSRKIMAKKLKWSIR